MKIIIHIKNKFYEKSLRRFFNYRWNFKERVEFQSQVNRLYPDEILLTDDEAIFSKFREQAFFLGEDEDMEERRISKFSRFDRIMQSISPESKVSDVENKKLKLITVSSLQGGAGKTSVLRHLAHFLNLKYHVCILNLFGNERESEVADLSEFMLEYQNTGRIRHNYFYHEPYCNLNMAGLVNLDDLQSILPKLLYRNITEFLSANSVELLLFEIPHPSIEICRYFMRRADYNLIVSDCKRESDKLSNLYLNCMNSHVHQEIKSLSNNIVLQNFSESNSMSDLPEDEYLFKGDGSVNENSAFYDRIRELIQGVLNV